MAPDSSDVPTEEVAAVTRRLTPETAAKLLEELAAHDEAVVLGHEVQLRQRRGKDVWEALLPHVLEALAMLRVRSLRFELRSFASCAPSSRLDPTSGLRTPWTVLDGLTLPSLERLDLGLHYSPPGADFAEWFNELKARHPLLLSTAKTAWRPAGWPRLEMVGVTGTRSDVELEPRSGTGLGLREWVEGDDVLDYPVVGCELNEDEGLLLTSRFLPEGVVVLHNGRPLALTKDQTYVNNVPRVVYTLPHRVLVDGDRIESGAMHFTVHERDHETWLAARAAALPPSAGLEALRARRPAPEERALCGWPFLRLQDGTLATMTSTGDLAQVRPDEGLEGLRRALSFLDPKERLSTEDAGWLVETFTGWQLLPGNPESAEAWLTNDGVGRATVFVGDDALRVTVGRRSQEALELRAELAMLEVHARGDARLATHDTFQLVAPPLFHELVPRFGVEGAAALWRFRHFRRNGSGPAIQAGVDIRRVDVGPFTWLVLEADGWLMEVTAVTGKAVELSRRRKTDPLSGHRSPEDAAMVRLTRLLESVDLARVTEPDLAALAPHLVAGELVGRPTRSGSRITFIVRTDSELGGEEELTFVVDLAQAPHVSHRVRHLGQGRLKTT